MPIYPSQEVVRQFVKDGLSEIHGEVTDLDVDAFIEAFPSMLATTDLLTEFDACTMEAPPD